MASIIHLPRSSTPARPPQRPLVGIVVQARMGSKRFPGKVLAQLAGKPVLQHVIERCKEIKVANNCDKKIIVAVPDLDESDPLVELTAILGVDNFCGSEDNVLERYYHAAKFFNLNVIMRITADCPLINPKICEEVLNIFAIEKECDYASNIYPTRTFPKGLDCEVFSFDCLEATYVKVMENYSKIDTVISSINDQNTIDMNLASVKYDTEHVTPFMQRTNLIIKASVRQRKNHSHQNLCVDYPKDIERLEKLINKKPKLRVVK